MGGVLIGFPCERTVMNQALDGMAGVIYRAALHGWDIFNFGYRFTDVARNQMAEKLLESDNEWLCMLDSDHRHAPDVVEALLACALAFPEQVDVMSGLNYRRGYPYEPMAYRYNAEGRLRPLYTWGEGMIEVDAVATCACLIHRRVFEALKPPWFWFSYSEDGRWQGEDINFFKRLKRETPFRVWVHPQITSPHFIVDEIGDDRRYREALAEDKAEQEQDNA